MTAQQPIRDFKFRWQEAVNDSPISDALCRTAMAMFSYADSNGEGIYPGHDELARRRRKSVRSIGAHISELIELGVIEKVSDAVSPGRSGGRGRAAEYALAWDQEKIDRKFPADESGIDRNPCTSDDSSNDQQETSDDSPPEAGMTGSFPLMTGSFGVNDRKPRTSDQEPLPNNQLQEKKSQRLAADAKSEFQLSPLQAAADRIGKATKGSIPYAAALKIIEPLCKHYAPDVVSRAAVTLYESGEPVTRMTIVKAIDPSVGMNGWGRSNPWPLNDGSDEAQAPVWNPKNSFDDDDVLEEAPEPDEAMSAVKERHTAAVKEVEALIDRRLSGLERGVVWKKSDEGCPLEEILALFVPELTEEPPTVEELPWGTLSETSKAS